jgi:hypothetical protein
MSRVLNKAWAVSEAWLKKFGVRPTLNQVALVLAVGEHESGMGDAWAADYGVRNWGAAQLLYSSGWQITQAERAQLGSPNIAFAHAIHGPHAARPYIPQTFDRQIPLKPYQDARRFLYVDSNVKYVNGQRVMVPYWIFEAGFGTDRDAIYYLLFSIPLMQGAITPDFMATATTDELAVEMKKHGYYGVSVPEYQSALRAVMPSIEAGLAGFDPENPMHDPGSDDPLPIPPTWGKAPAPSQAGGGAPSESSSSPASGSVPPPPSPSGGAPDLPPAPFVTAIDNTLDLEEDELEDTKD